MSFTVGQFESRVKDIINYPEIKDSELILSARDVLNKLELFYDWDFLNKVDSSLTATIDSKTLDISTLTDISKINQLFFDSILPANRVNYVNKNNFLSTSTVEDGLYSTDPNFTGTPKYYNDEIEADKIYFNVKFSEAKTIVLLYKSKVPITDSDDVSKELITEKDDNIGLPNKFQHIFELGLIKNTLPLASSKLPMITYYNQLFADAILELKNEEDRETDLTPKLSMQQRLVNSRLYRKVRLQNRNFRSSSY